MKRQSWNRWIFRLVVLIVVLAGLALSIAPWIMRKKLPPKIIDFPARQAVYAGSSSAFAVVGGIDKGDITKDGFFGCWNPIKQEWIRLHHSRDKVYSCIAHSPKDNNLIIASKRLTRTNGAPYVLAELHVVSLTTGDTQTVVSQEHEQMLSICLSDDGKHCATAQWSNASGINIWQCADWRLARTLRNPHSGTVRHVSFCNNEIVISCGGRSVAATSIIDGSSRELYQCSSNARRCAVSPEGSIVAIVSDYSPLIVVDIHSGNVVAKLTQCPAEPTHVVFSPDGERLVIGTEGKSICVFRRRDWSIEINLTTRRKWTRAVAFDMSCSVLLAIETDDSENSEIELWDCNSWSRLDKTISTIPPVDIP